LIKFSVALIAGFTGAAGSDEPEEQATNENIDNATNTVAKHFFIVYKLMLLNSGQKEITLLPAVYW
jgi:hypothetical protein